MQQQLPFSQGDGAARNRVPATLTHNVLTQLGLSPHPASPNSDPEAPALLLKSYDWHVRLQAVVTMSLSTLQEQQEQLLVLVADPHPSVRAATIRLLNNTGINLPLTQLIEISASDPDWRVREVAVRALGKYEGAGVVAALLASLHDADETVRAATVHTLGLLGKHVAPNELLLALQDRSWVVRETAAWTCKTLSNQGIALPPEALLVAARDQDDMVRTAATQALNGVALTERIASHWSLVRTLLYSWQLLQKQARLIHRGIWIAPLLVVLSIVILISTHGSTQIQNAVSVLAIFTTAAAALGATFLYGMKHDAGFELTCVTPTSMRLIVFCRFLLVVGYNIALACGMSALLAALHQGSFLAILQIWLGPLCLLASVALALSSLFGTWGAALIALLLEATQSFQMKTATPGIDITLSPLWQTNLPLLMLATLCLVVALWSIQRRENDGAFSL